jgi:hypothetical protein
LSQYQLGLITVSRDRLREHSPATKFPYYFAYGLPVLFPEWMKEGHEYDAAIPYAEESFVQTVQEIACDRRRWTDLSNRARSIAESLTWEKVLLPLDELINNGTRHAVQTHLPHGAVAST